MSSRRPNTEAEDRIVLSMKLRLYVMNMSGMSRQSILRSTRFARSSASWGSRSGVKVVISYATITTEFATQYKRRSVIFKHLYGRHDQASDASLIDS